MNVWRFQDGLTRLLALWAAANIIVGLALMLITDHPFRGFGEMTVGWALVNLAIAFFGQLGSKRRRSQPDGMAPAVMLKEQTKLSRLLWLNTGLDVVYVAVGLWLAIDRGAADPRMLGWGYAIIIQGAFLFFFDLFHALRLRQPLSAAG